MRGKPARDQSLGGDPMRLTPASHTVAHQPGIPSSGDRAPRAVPTAPRRAGRSDTAHVTDPMTSPPTCRGARLLTVTSLTALALLLAASSAHADAAHVVALAATVDAVLTNIRNWIMGILAGLATVFLSV